MAFETSAITAAPRRARAMSMLEVVLVLVILAVTAGIAVPRWAGASLRYRLDQTTRKVQQDLALARRHAKATGASQTVTFSTANNNYTMPGLDDLQDSTQDYTVDVTAAPYEAELTAASFGGSSSISFDAWGAPSHSGTVTVRVGTSVATVSVESETGKVTIP